MELIELRLGNYVMANGNLFIVNSICYEPMFRKFHITVVKKLGDIPSALVGFEPSPIPLTEELLLSCGFIEDDAFAYLSDEEDSQYPVFKHNGFALLLKEGAFYVYEECDEDCWYNYYWHEIKYLHKLQNYVYETQDEELPINLT